MAWQEVTYPQLVATSMRQEGTNMPGVSQKPVINHSHEFLVSGMTDSLYSNRKHKIESSGTEETFSSWSINGLFTILLRT